VVKPGERVTVRVLSADVQRQRIALSMKDASAGDARPAGQGRPAEMRKHEPARKPEPKRAPEPQPGVAPNGMRIVSRK